MSDPLEALLASPEVQRAYDQGYKKGQADGFAAGVAAASKTNRKSAMRVRGPRQRADHWFERSDYWYKRGDVDRARRLEQQAIEELALQSPEAT